MQQHPFDGRSLRTALEERLRAREGRYSLSELLYFTSYGAFLVLSILAFSFFARQVSRLPYGLIAAICVVPLVLKEMLSEHDSLRELLSLMLCTALFLIVLSVGQDVEEICIAFQIIYIFSARDISFDRIARFTLAMTGTLCVFIVGCSQLGVIPNVVLMQEAGSRVRQCLGFRYALYLPALFLNLTALWAYEHRGKPMLPGALILLLLNRWIYACTDSRSTYFLTMVLLVAALVLNGAPGLIRRLRPVFRLMVFAYPVAAGVSLWATACYDRTAPWTKWLHRDLALRLRLGQASIRDYGFSLFGENINWVGAGLDANGHVMQGQYNFVDCLYLQLLQHFGVLFFAVWLVVMTLLLYRCYQRGEYYLMVVLAAAAIHGMTDDLNQYLPFQSVWMAIGPLLIGGQGERALLWNSAEALRYQPQRVHHRARRAS